MARDVKNKAADSSSAPYDKTHTLERVSLMFAIVPDGQAGAVIKDYVSFDGALSFITHGKGTASSDFYDVLGLGEDKKQIVISLIKDSTWFKLKKTLKDRFLVSEYTKGIAFTCDISALCGVSTYKMIVNNRGINKPSEIKEEAKMEKKNTDYELVISIVNDGFTDLVMDAAKKAGARGGTILDARGTGNKEIEKFFGVIITPEKKIVMILVPKKIRDDVLNSINKEVGIDTKGQGIAFSLPASDVVGLSGEETRKEDNK